MDSTKVREQLDLAAYYATRSGIKSYRTGAVILSSRGAPISNGWSHYSELNYSRYRSIHAELHAILRTPFRALLDDGTAFIATVRTKSGRIGLGKPCLFCHELLYEVGIKRAYYTTDGAKWDSISIS